MPLALPLPTLPERLEELLDELLEALLEELEAPTLRRCSPSKPPSRLRTSRKPGLSCGPSATLPPPRPKLERSPPLPKLEPKLEPKPRPTPNDDTPPLPPLRPPTPSTPTSLLPEQAAHTGMGFGALCAWMVEQAACRA